MICLVMATMLEAEPFISGLRLSKRQVGPVALFTGEGETTLLVSGVGKVNAAMATACVCREFNPRILCNLGAAGANRDSVAAGDIFHIDKVLELDRPHFQTGRPYRYTPEVLPGFSPVTLATQDRAVISEQDRQCVAKHADLADMEGSAIVQVCRKMKIRCCLFKQVTDTPEHQQNEMVVNNIKELRGQLYTYYCQHIASLLRA